MKSTTFNAAVLFFASFLFVSVSYGQQNSFFVGATAGGNLSNFKFQDYKDEYSTSALLGANGGLTFGLRFNKIYIVSGLNYFQKGAKYESPVQGWDFTGDGYANASGFFDMRERHNYLSVPIMVRVHLLGEEAGLTLGAGLAFNFGMSADLSGRFQYINPSDESLTSEVDIDEVYHRTVLDYGFGDNLDDEYKKVQTSFQLSPGFVTPIGQNGKLHINIGLDIGLGDSYNEKFKDSFNVFGKQVNRSTTFSISYEHHLDLNIGSKY